MTERALTHTGAAVRASFALHSRSLSAVFVCLLHLRFRLLRECVCVSVRALHCCFPPSDTLARSFFVGLSLFFFIISLTLMEFKTYLT